MQYAFRFLITAITLLAACVDTPNESTKRSSVVTSNRITANRITANRITANRITANRIAATRITANRLRVNSAASELLATPEGRELFSVLVSCALPEEVTLVATVDDAEIEFFGEIGLAAQWLYAPLDREGQGWVSACVFARVNLNAVEVQISIRGPHGALQPLDPFEREAWSLEEGAFYGNMFTPLDQPLVWIACRGADQATGETGGLIDRDCTEEDPANPGLTKCGFTFAGDCGHFTGEAACERFSEHGEFYQRCHAAPIDDDHHGRGDLHHGRFRQVITTYVLP